MSDLTWMDKPLVWLSGEVKTPPFSSEARVEAGILLRRLQRGERLVMPKARPMPVIGARCSELRIVDRGHNWRIFVRTDTDAVLVLDIIDKKTQATPPAVITRCQARPTQYERIRSDP